MAQDKDAVAFHAEITVVLSPVNKYGDVLDGGGVLTFTKKLPNLTLAQIAEKLAVID